MIEKHDGFPSICSQPLVYQYRREICVGQLCFVHWLWRFWYSLHRRQEFNKAALRDFCCGASMVIRDLGSVSTLNIRMCIVHSTLKTVNTGFWKTKITLFWFVWWYLFFSLYSLKRGYFHRFRFDQIEQHTDVTYFSLPYDRQRIFDHCWVFLVKEILKMQASIFMKAKSPKLT